MLHLGTLRPKKLYPISKQCFIFIVLPSNICVLSIPFFFLHRGEKARRTALIRGDQRPPTSGRRGNPPKTNRAGGGRCDGNWHHNR
ncbi:hypothetical protein AB205_0167430 [Aquarana catesbeiana]|uniref:Uncharacterized protein n=1 Tax=Aquarana catesbeiana TaxID=8400 RepID=A0A2G9Q954_AQUCT|nr:hypothetical protein AB205_0167430 [Aquarana catesbeiana]